LVNISSPSFRRTRALYIVIATSAGRAAFDCSAILAKQTHNQASPDIDGIAQRIGLLASRSRSEDRLYAVVGLACLKHGVRTLLNARFGQDDKLDCQARKSIAWTEFLPYAVRT